MITIRKAKNAEKKEAIKIIRDEIYEELSEKEMREWIDKGWGKFPYLQCFVATEDKKLIGVIFWSLWDRGEGQGILEITAIAVKGENRKKGIGKKMLSESLERVKNYWLEKKGLKIIAYCVETDQYNRQAQRFYKSLSPDSSFLVSNIWGPDGNQDGILQYFYRLQ